MKLGALFAGHVHPWEELVELVRLAEELGYDAAWVDGDVSMLGRRQDQDTLDGWLPTMASHLRRSTRRRSVLTWPKCSRKPRTRLCGASFDTVWRCSIDKLTVPTQRAKSFVP